MPLKPKDRTGVRYGNLVALRISPKNTCGNTMWVCWCDCGTERTVKSSELMRISRLDRPVKCRCTSKGERTGERYGRLVIIARNRTTKSKLPRFDCICDCGKTVTVFICNLRASSGHTQSCGCLRDERVSAKNIRHGHLVGKRYAPEYQMLGHARRRSKHLGLPFDLVITDIVIPKICPLLGVPIFRAERGYCDNSASLDRIIPVLGYVKSNVWVISRRANTIKNNASVEELECLTKGLKRKIQQLSQSSVVPIAA
jgi:hypothetical protein